MSQKSISGKNLEKTISSDDLLGKNVIDKSGEIIGVSEKILIDPDALELIGLEVDKGFLKKGLTISRQYIEKVTPHAIFLKIRVAYEIKGLIVFDRNGSKIGTVSKVNLHGQRNSIKSITINKSILSKELEVTSDQIETIGENIILKISKQDLRKKEENERKI